MKEFNITISYDKEEGSVINIYDNIKDESLHYLLDDGDSLDNILKCIIDYFKIIK